MVTLDLVVKFQLFLIILVRLFGMFVVAPFFGSMSIPARVKALLAFFIAIVLFPMVAQLPVRAELSALPYLLQLSGELLIGIVIGFMVSIFFAAFQFAGQIFSFQMGLSITMVFDPQSQVQLPIIGQLLSLFALMVFLNVNAHHHLIQGVYKSYQTIPVLQITEHASLIAKGAVHAFTRMFGAAIHVGLPIMATAFLISVTMGILAKTAPQMNILMLGFPIQITVGFTMLTLAVPFMFRFMANWINRGIQFTHQLIAGL